MFYYYLNSYQQACFKFICIQTLTHVIGQGCQLKLKANEYSLERYLSLIHCSCTLLFCQDPIRWGLCYLCCSSLAVALLALPSLVIIILCSQICSTTYCYCKPVSMVSHSLSYFVGVVLIPLNTQDLSWNQTLLGIRCFQS